MKSCARLSCVLVRTLACLMDASKLWPATLLPYALKRKPILPQLLVLHEASFCTLASARTVKASSKSILLPAGPFLPSICGLLRHHGHDRGI